MHTDERTATRVQLLNALFEQQVQATPNAIALDVPPHPGQPGRVRLSYAQLDAEAEALAARLAPHVSGECVVAIVIPRTGADLYVAQLAVLKAGAAYTCIEPGSPPERLRFLLEDSRAVAVVAGAPELPLLTRAGVPAQRIVPPTASGTAATSRSRPSWVTPETLAYVIYTSGTTGHPKGVMIEHRNIANLVTADASYFDLRPGDRVAQTTSAAYDSSVEEIWMAWGTGATVVVVDDELVRSGPDLVPWLRDEHITVWCPAPTLLRMTGCEDPSRELPGLRLLYVGGEELTADVAQRWAPGRRLENGYGPTECTVTVVRAPVRAGEPVTIGRPVPGNRGYIVDSELREVPEGHPGELVIAGAGVARGYLHRADLTAERFLSHPVFGRIYRTGDLVRRSPGGDLLYLGRADTQVKVRGHRIELTAVESELCRCPGILEAACRIQKNGTGPELIAFVVTETGADPDREQLRDQLRRTLPEPMLPARIARLDALPRGAFSGKLDRQALPELPHEHAAHTGSGRAPAGELELQVAAAFTRHLSAPVTAEADFFLDLAGNSLLAAQVISSLRREPSTAALTVRDLYALRTVAGLAARAATNGASTHRTRAPRATSAAAPAWQRPAVQERPHVSPHAAWGVAAQALFLAGALVAVVNLAWLVAFRIVPVLTQWLGATLFVLLLPTFVLAGAIGWSVVAAVLTVAAKRVLIGRYTAGRHPYLGSMYVRHWIVNQFARSLPWGLLESTGLRSLVLRALGARIGEDVHLHRGVALHHGGWDLLEIGDEAALGRDVSIGLVSYDQQQLVFAPITIGARATLDTRSRMGPGSCIEPEGFLSALSWLADGATLRAGECWDGVPAQRAGTTPPSPPPSDEPPRPSALHSMVLLIAKAVVAQVAFLPAMVLAAVVLSAWRSSGAAATFWNLPLGALAAAVMGGYLLSLPLQAFLCRVLPRVVPGVYPLRGGTALTVLLKERLVESANVALSGTLAWPMWLRAAGMRVGRRCEISTIMEVTPELLEIADDCFFADGIYLGRPLVHRGHLHCARTTFSRHTFIGNHAVIPAGAALPPDILLGVCTVAEPERIRAGSGWFGHPAFELPRREMVAAHDSLTFSPSAVRVLNRVLWESMRLTLPVLPAFLLVFWATTLPRLATGLSGTALHLGLLPLLAVGTGVFLCVLTLATKWLLLGRMRPGHHVLWSCWCCRWDFVYEIWSAYGRPVIECLEGTPAVAWWLRAMGARIGHRVVIGTSLAQLVDPDMLAIDDDATVSCHLQLHSFEDRVLKLGPSRIGAGSTVAAGSLLLYGAEIGPRATVAELGVVMKHEHLSPAQRYEGVPTHPAPGAHT